MENIFVYGTLQNSTQRFWILKHRVEAEYDILKDYTKVMHSYLITYPTIKKEKGKVVVGKEVWAMVPTQEKQNEN